MDYLFPNFRNDDDNNSKHGDGEDGEEDVSVLTPMRSTSRAESKDNEDRPSSSGKHGNLVEEISAKRVVTLLV